MAGMKKEMRKGRHVRKEKKKDMQKCMDDRRMEMKIQKERI